jgi:o-succinylbenzoate synthase
MNNIKIDAVYAYHISIPLKYPFRISVGEVRHKECVIFECRSNNHIGWGEAAVDAIPFYTPEVVGSVLDVAANALVPLLKSRAWNSPGELSKEFEKSRGNCFAKAGLDAAFWDIYGKSMSSPCWKLLGGTRPEIESGPSIGIKKCPQETVDAVCEQLELGRKRIKLKVCPGFDSAYIEAVRNKFPDISLMVDGNNAYSPEDFDLIASWDKFNLLMIEQPLDEHDIYYHSLLRKHVNTPICLDESIHTLHDARCAIEMQAADIINIKVGRVGGLTNAKMIHDLCAKHNIPNWIGSRIGTSVAEAMRLAAATLKNCSLPSDMGFARMYMSDDIVKNAFKENNGCMYKASEVPGFGLEMDRDLLKKYTLNRVEL